VPVNGSVDWNSAIGGKPPPTLRPVLSLNQA
jgi:hypothetical protein